MAAHSPLIDAHFIFNSTMRCLVEEYFLPSIPKTIRPAGEFLEIWSSGNYDQDNYNEIVQLKTRRIIQAIERGEMNSVFLWCDVDLVFLDDTTSELMQYIKGVDLAYQREWTDNDQEANSGFQVIRRNKDTKNFYEEVLWHQENLSPPHDQLWVNHLLRKSSAPKWSLLPYKYSSGSNGGLRHDSVLYHANNTVVDSMSKKREALDQALAFAHMRRHNEL